MPTTVFRRTPDGKLLIVLSDGATWIASPDFEPFQPAWLALEHAPVTLGSDVGLPTARLRKLLMRAERYDLAWRRSGPPG